MNKNSQTYLLSPYLLFSLCINIFFIIDALLFHTLKEVANFLKIMVASFLLMILAYSIYRKHHITKINVNYKFLFISLCAFIGIILYHILYALLIVKSIDPIIIFLLVSISVVLLILAFIKNYSKPLLAVEFFIAPSLALVVIKFVLICFAYLLTDFTCLACNPDRYEFVKQHYFSSQEIASFPKEIPSDASDISLKCFKYNGDKELTLQFTLKNGETKVYEYPNNE